MTYIAKDHHQDKYVSYNKEQKKLGKTRRRSWIVVFMSIHKKLVSGRNYSKSKEIYYLQYSSFFYALASA